MTSAIRTAPAGGQPRLRLMAVLLAVVLALLTGLAGFAAPRSTTAPTTAPAHQAAAVAPKALSRTATRHPAPHRVVAKPTLRTVLLRPGDTLWALAHRYRTTVRAFQRANHLGTSTVIRAGRRLSIPASAAPNRPGGAGGSPRHGTARSTPPTSGATGAVVFARRQLGAPYRWGGTGSGGWDCSGLIQAAWRHAGISLPRTTAAQARAGTRVTRSALQPGDLVFTRGYGHVQLYAGDGRVIEAPHTGTRVRYAPLPRASAVDAYVRVRAAARTISAATGAGISSTRPITGASGSARQLARQAFGPQHACAAHIIARESGWRTTAANAASGAYGLAQAVPGSKMARYGTDWRTNPATQLRWMRSYVNSRYGGACSAWAFWQAHHWY
ncbi:NlpC/P60 family protein [Streptomyces sp. NPDC007851]|uniref:C40 family peptidase n=1 Tax=Streptomyces sp. NPDC007851 TaxID=3155008 RepID=UPI0033CB231B